LKGTLATCLLAALGWHDWVQLGDVGDQALAAGDAAGAEAKYRQALDLGSRLRETPDVDPHLSRLVASLAAQGKCQTPREAAAALAGMLAVARGEASVASAEFEKVTLAAKGCRATVTDEVLGLLRWSAGDAPAALALRKRALAARCKALKPDPLDEAAIALNGAWKAGTETRWAAALATAQNNLGPHHPLIAIALERRAALLEAAGDGVGAKRQRTRADEVRATPYCKSH